MISRDFYPLVTTFPFLSIRKYIFPALVTTAMKGRSLSHFKVTIDKKLRQLYRSEISGKNKLADTELKHDLPLKFSVAILSVARKHRPAVTAAEFKNSLVNFTSIKMVGIKSEFYMGFGQRCLYFGAIEVLIEIKSKISKRPCRFPMRSPLRFLSRVSHTILLAPRLNHPRNAY